MGFSIFVFVGLVANLAYELIFFYNLYQNPTDSNLLVGIATCGAGFVF